MSREVGCVARSMLHNNSGLNDGTQDDPLAGQFASMTQHSEIVDPPLACRNVQITLAGLVGVGVIFAALSVRNPPLNQLSNSTDVRLEIDINQADPRELTLLPGVGPMLAKRIAENRQRVGPFVSVEDLSRVHGVGPKTLQQIRVYCVAGPTDGIQQVEVANIASFDPLER
jgi:competence ComEA-like helix-hairpin-helix protein